MNNSVKLAMDNYVKLIMDELERWRGILELLETGQLQASQGFVDGAWRNVAIYETAWRRVSRTGQLRRP